MVICIKQKIHGFLHIKKYLYIHRDVYVYIKEKYIKKIILYKMHLELTGTLEGIGAAASFPISGTDKLAVQTQKHAVITSFFF